MLSIELMELKSETIKKNKQKNNFFQILDEKLFLKERKTFFFTKNFNYEKESKQNTHKKGKN